MSPAAFGITRKTWANIVSNALAALEHVELARRPFRHMNLNQDWQRLYDRLTVLNHRAALGRFMRYCSNQNLHPRDVSDATVEEFERVLRLASLRKRPDLAIYYLTRSWNKAVEAIEEWPSWKLTVPSRRVLLAQDLDELPDTFVDDLQRYLDQLRNPDVLAEHHPMRRAAPATIKHRDAVIRRFVGDLVRSGVSPSDITGLSVVVQPENVRRGLRVMLERRRDELSTTVHVLAIILKGIAANYVRLPPEALAQLDTICTRLRPKRRGMTEKNRARLRQMDDPFNVQALLHLPADLQREAHTRDLSPKQAAQRMEVALAIALELMAPLRIKNLATLHIDRHFQGLRATKAGARHLVIPAAEVKNGEPLEFELNSEVLELLDLYLKEHRHHLAPSWCRWLFACRDGADPVDPVVLARRIKTTIRERTGLEINPHLFRAIAAKLYLDRHPGGYEVVRRLLGHKALATTIAAYTGLEGISAAKHFDQTIREIREQSKEQRRRRKVNSP